MENNLILLDVDGILISKDGSKCSVRNGAKDFVMYCFTIGKVGIYSSMYMKNITKKLGMVLTKDEINSLFCIFDRSYTYKDPEGVNDWDTLKDLKFISDMYPSIERVVLCDDTYSKVRYIDKDSVIISTDLEEIKKQLIKKLNTES